MPLAQIAHADILMLVHGRLGAPVADGGANLLVIPRTHPDPDVDDIADPITGIASWARLMHADVAQNVRHEDPGASSTIPATGTARIHLLVVTSMPGPASDVYAHEKYLDSVVAAISGRFMHAATEGAVTAELDTTVHVTHFETLAVQAPDDTTKLTSMTHLILHAQVHAGTAVG